MSWSFTAVCSVDRANATRKTLASVAERLKNRGLRHRSIAAMIHVILFQPEIPQNTGNVGRMCALTKSRLHLIHPLGFKITDRNLRRAGMDYWFSLDIHEHADWDAFRSSPAAPRRLWLFTTRSEVGFWKVRFEDGDGLVFGNEGSGAPEWLHKELSDRSVTIPHANPDLRSLNLSTAAGIAAYEALRQIGGFGEAS